MPYPKYHVSVYCSDDRMTVLTSLSSSLVSPSTDCDISATSNAPSALLEVVEANDIIDVRD
jgi:hypothetical protein